MLRRLLNIASVVCLVLCVPLMGLWVRSYSWMDDYIFTPGVSSVGVGSASGRIAIGIMSAKINPEQNLFEFTHSLFADWVDSLSEHRHRLFQQAPTLVERGVKSQPPTFVCLGSGNEIEKASFRLRSSLSNGSAG